MKEYYTTKQYAQLLGVHPQTIRRYERDGKITCIRTLGNHRRFRFCLDVVEIITVFTSKIYGLRAHKNKKTLAAHAANAQL
jgi:excisionase family DNA binding protein